MGIRRVNPIWIGGLAILLAAIVGCGRSPKRSATSAVPPTARCFVKHGAKIAQSAEEISFFLREEERGNVDDSGGAIYGKLSIGRNEPSRAVGQQPKDDFVAYVAQPAGRYEDKLPASEVVRRGPNAKYYVAYVRTPTPEKKYALWRCIEKLGSRENKRDRAHRRGNSALSGPPEVSNFPAELPKLARALLSALGPGPEDGSRPGDIPRLARSMLGTAGVAAVAAVSMISVTGEVPDPRELSDILKPHAGDASEYAEEYGKKLARSGEELVGWGCAFKDLRERDFICEVEFEPTNRKLAFDLTPAGRGRFRAVRVRKDGSAIRKAVETPP